MSAKTRTGLMPVYRLHLIRDGWMTAMVITSPLDVAKECEDLAKADREQMLCLHLDTKHRPIGCQLISVGTLNSTVVHPREVFKAALLRNAHAVLLAHNHPSGDASPSREDDEITRTVALAGAVLSVKLLDHVILTPDSQYYSYRQHRPALLMDGSAASVWNAKTCAPIAASPRCGRKTRRKTARSNKNPPCPG